jgi:hypothetical protein
MGRRSVIRTDVSQYFRKALITSCQEKQAMILSCSCNNIDKYHINRPIFFPFCKNITELTIVNLKMVSLLRSITPYKPELFSRLRTLKCVFTILSKEKEYPLYNQLLSLSNGLYRFIVDFTSVQSLKDIQVDYPLSYSQSLRHPLKIFEVYRLGDLIEHGWNFRLQGQPIQKCIICDKPTPILCDDYQENKNCECVKNPLCVEHLRQFYNRYKLEKKSTHRFCFQFIYVYGIRSGIPIHNIRCNPNLILHVIENNKDSDLDPLVTCSKCFYGIKLF